ncbi:Protein CBG16801 [Caenorhabditis briggsae]|uniref:Uncharacterized protein n=2 Tax=Caenorhabditis briggsae TaxID=6238 RepID=A0AAE9FC15_CAEBR|nr:Protein CBG16801 [Caenorhabditis briggsae]ULT83263.1 hypothetical protein L3Y34_012484 [Caenorhabditis briggsae]UMM42546.1 hypothetical protein L5515_018340 [Caenorhabditis briggsae]CAP34669.2 Protein CBG16801 [Caenorhabditis briggsae]
MVSLTGALGMPPFRERLGTGCTKDSKDSGIEVRPKAKRHRNRARMQTSARKKPISSIEEQVADNRQEDARRYAENSIVIGLWLVVLYVTNLTFGLPLKIMWPARINHAAVALSYLLIGIWVLCAIYFYIRKRSDEMRWHKTYPKTYYFAWMVQLMGFALFCLATYPQIHRWSLLVSIFYFSFFATISNTFL